MSAIGLRVGPFEIVGRTLVPEPGSWHLARRTGMTRRQPTEALVRLLPPDAPPEARESLHRQFELLKALEDPRVPEAVAFYEGLGALALSAVDGVPLSEVIAARRDEVVQMSPATLLDLVLEVAESLQRVHHRNRFHGDLSPDRILLAADGKLWLFGFGHPWGGAPAPGWLAPEVARGEPPGPATDQWHLGVLLIGLVTGKAPWSEGGESTVAEAARGVPEGLVEPVERQWPALGRLVRRLTESRPENRFPSMHPVRQELLALARKAGGTSARRELGADIARPRALLLDPDPALPVVPRSPEPVVDDHDLDAPDAAETLAPISDPPAHGLPPDGFGPVGEVPVPPPDLPSSPDVTGPELSISEEIPPPPRRAAVGRLPDEPFPVVRPEVGTEVPEAHVGLPRTPAPAPSRPESPIRPRTPDPALTADVVVDDTDERDERAVDERAVDERAVDERAVDDGQAEPSLAELADAFASEVEPAGSQTLVPATDEPSDPAAARSTPPPGEVSLGLGRALASDDGPQLDDLMATPGPAGGFFHDDPSEADLIGPAPEPPTPTVPTDDLVRRIAPLAVGGFALAFVVWLILRLV